MTTPASIAKHPVHPMLITLPIGMWVFSLVADLVFQFGSPLPFWKDVAYYSMIAGLIGALLAAVPGLIDLGALRDPALRRLGMSHLVMNLVVVGLYVVNLLLRRSGPTYATGPVWLSVGSLMLLMVSGWVGAELVHVHGVSIAAPRTPERPIDIAVTPPPVVPRHPMDHVG